MGSTALFVDLPAGVCGYYDHETGNIYVDKRMPNRSQRCTFEHELTHRILGHGPARSLTERLQREIAVERITARRLIPFSSLLSAMTKFTNSAAIADALDVDEDLLYARVFNLTAEEQTIFEVCGRYCIGIGSIEAMRPAPVLAITSRMNGVLLAA